MSSSLAHGAALAARVAACCLVALVATAHAQESEEVFGEHSLSPEFTEPADQSVDSGAELLESGAAEFDQWEPLVESDSMLAPLEEPPADLRPFDWMRHWGFHHSSTEGRFMDKGLAMERSSWLNRPYHLDWFAGPLLSTGPVDGRVQQGNELFGGLRIGWDFDYYWGVEWRFGWSDPTLLATLTSVNDDGDTVFTDAEFNGHYFVSDVDFVYYPWGDTKVRPYALLGLGMAQVGSVRPDGAGQEATLLGMPMGIGVHFPQTHWLTWRLEIIDNLAWGAEGVDTLNNFAFTAGMELRMGARPNSYWPWRSSRTIW